MLGIDGKTLVGITFDYDDINLWPKVGQKGAFVDPVSQSVVQVSLQGSPTLDTIAQYMSPAHAPSSGPPLGGVARPPALARVPSRA